MRNKLNIFLIGPMGSGKSSVGKKLAKELGLRFFDSDAEVEQRTGVNISYIFEKEGENGFRTREKNIIAEFVQKKGLVLATGGGSVMDKENRQKLSKNGTVVYLKTSVDQQLKRAKNTQTRPLLAHERPKEILEHLRTIREPLYEEIADVLVDTDGCQMNTVVTNVLNILLERDLMPLQK